MGGISVLLLRRILLPTLGLVQLSIPCHAQSLPTCRKHPDRNGSALCLQLTIEKGQVAIAGYQFDPTESYANRRSLVDEFVAQAKFEIAHLTKPCISTMSQQQLKAYLQNPSGNAATSSICSGDFNWAEFVRAFEEWGRNIGRASHAANALGESGIFRPLVKLYQRSPLLWIETSGESLDAEHGVIKLLVADPIDPRTEGSFSISIEGLEDGPVKNERLANLRRALHPLQSAVFCHDDVRAEITAFYAKIGVSAQIIELSPQLPAVRILEKHP